jgi:hypothetical protein
MSISSRNKPYVIHLCLWLSLEFIGWTEWNFSWLIFHFPLKYQLLKTLNKLINMKIPQPSHKPISSHLKNPDQPANNQLVRTVIQYRFPIRIFPSTYQAIIQNKNVNFHRISNKQTKQINFQQINISAKHIRPNKSWLLCLPKAREKFKWEMRKTRFFLLFAINEIRENCFFAGFRC